MSIDELKQVLAKIQLGDSRQVDRLILAEWNDTIGHLDFADSITAVTMHRRESDKYLMPSHIVANVRRIQHDRAEANGLPEVQQGHPKPNNMAALEAAAASKDRVLWAVEIAKYNEQLREAGYPEVRA